MSYQRPTAKYYSSIFEREISPLLSCSDGFNNALYLAARHLGRHIPCGGFSREQLETELFRVSESTGYVARDGVRQTWATIRSGLKAGTAKPASGPSSFPAKLFHRSYSSSNCQTQSVAPRVIAEPNEQWVRSATAFFNGLHYYELSIEQRAEADRLLGERGLDPRTAYTQLNVKYNPRDVFPLRRDWGLPPHPDTKSLKTVIPRGLTIACRTPAGSLVGLDVRCADYETGKRGYKFHEVAGSAKPLAYAIGTVGAPCIICESALDTALVFQQTRGAYICVAALGTKAIAGEWQQFVQQAPRIIYIMDTDAAGSEASKAIKKMYPSAVIMSVPNFKDPTAATKKLGPIEGCAYINRWLESEGLL